MPPGLQQTKVLLVEGKDEVNFFSAIKDLLQFRDIEIRSFEGGDNLAGFLEALKGVEGFDRVVSVGIIRDAEGNGGGAFQSVQTALVRAGLPAPATELDFAPGTPRIAVLINPYGRPAGRFDDVCAESVHGTPVMQCVERYIECLKGLGIGSPAKEWKTRVHAFIAAQDRPEVSLGVAAKRGYFPLDHIAFEPTRRLFQMVGNP